ncbi:MAG: alpha/beta hydrolase [Alphaproteobacteria bacterium]|nr:alpha/beta hydrolase [Alphaproteobacteria bacterium]
MSRLAIVAACLVLLTACGEPSPPQKTEAPKPPPVAVAPPIWQRVLTPPPLPAFDAHGTVAHAGAKIWHASIGQGTPVILLHGAFGSAENFGFQIPALVKAGYRVVLIETRGHGRSTRVANEPLTYELLSSDVVAVMDALKLPKASIVGWSDGAIQGLVIAMKNPKRLNRLFAFGANMDPSGAQPGITERPIFVGMMDQAAKDYARLSPTPGDFAAFSEAMFTMLTTQPNYAEKDLAKIRGPRIAIVDGEKEEFIKLEHTSFLGKAIPGAGLTILPGVSHFAPVQKPEEFNAAMLAFLGAP